MLECAINWDVRRVTVASTIGVYAGVPDLRGVSERLPLLHMAAGGNVVAASKKSAELLVSLCREHGVDAISVRLPAVWGPPGRILRPRDRGLPQLGHSPHPAVRLYGGLRSGRPHAE